MVVSREKLAAGVLVQAGLGPGSASLVLGSIGTSLVPDSKWMGLRLCSLGHTWSLSLQDGPVNWVQVDGSMGWSWHLGPQGLFW